MNIDQDDIGLWARMIAHEHLISTLWSNLLLTSPDPVKSVADFQQQFATLTPESRPEFDPQAWDSVVAETQQIYSQFWDGVRQTVNIGLAGKLSDE